MRQIVQRLQRHGIASTLLYSLIKALELIAEFRILRRRRLGFRVVPTGSPRALDARGSAWAK